MKTTPLKVLLLGWDAPDVPTDVVPPTSTLLQALAPRADLTLLLPRLSEPMRLSSLVQTTGLGNLTAEELVLVESLYESDRSQTIQWPAAPYLGATLSQEDSAGVPAAPYIGRSSEQADMPYEAPSADFGTVEEAAASEIGVGEAADLAFDDAPAQPDASAFAGEEAAESTDTPSFSSKNIAELEAVPSTWRTELPVHHSILDVAMAALQQLPTDDASLNFRVIQYARLATRLASSQDFSVIYASDWQSWLAGMEIRQLTGKPLVLHVYSLAQERNTPADRGWVTELERIALRRADLVLTATADLALRVIEMHDVAPQRVRRLSRAANQEPDLLAETILSALREVS
ncbi:glycosyltransferase [Hymenobacter tibetensis]|uniref:Glycosyltransferase n=1 Tax=Hymenobacter tibetensis TaxID=497967 RepID=A0ABY4CXJ9_9BACT|nr:glycosyltransferase [Hymenobacter tibetensis]UOG73751.1 glycosyltransferase [Hymenobacter tibetensis]